MKNTLAYFDHLREIERGKMSHCYLSKKLLEEKNGAIKTVADTRPKNIIAFCAYNLYLVGLSGQCLVVSHTTTDKL